MIWAKWKNEVGVGTPEIIYTGKGFKDENGISHPANIFGIWSAKKLAIVGWHEYVPFVVPDGKEAVSYIYTQEGLQIVESAITRPKIIPPEPTNAEIIDRELSNSKVLLGIVRMLAADNGITEEDVITNIKSQILDV